MRFFVVVILIALNSLLKAADYYVSSSGNDSNSGLGTSSPWKTIDKVNSAFSLLKPGDRILFKCGDTFYGTIKIIKSGTAGSPITIGSYGSGEKPVITGFKRITSWKNEGNGIYSATITSESQTNMVLINDKQYGMGRWPDSGYRTYKSAISNISITDPELPQTPNWKGAEVVIRKNDWSIDRCKITSHNGGTLTYTSLGSAHDAKEGFGYFIQNDLRTLSSFGEWYHDHAGGKIYFYFGSTSPSSLKVEIAALDNLLYNIGHDYITIDNLHFRGSASHMIQSVVGISDYITVRNSRFSYAGLNGINLYGNYSNISNNLISSCNQTGIKTDGIQHNITLNTIEKTGLIAGQSLWGNLTNGIAISNNNCLIKNNVIRETGYCAIILSSKVQEVTIQNNFIHDVLLTLNDGGGIYITAEGTSRKIDGNIILNVHGNLSGTNKQDRPIARGIYLDENSTNVIVTNNTVANCAEAGYMIHRGRKNRIDNNTAFNNAIGMYFQNSLANSIRDNQLNNNVFIAKSFSQTSLRFYSVSDDIPAFGTADKNYYARPVDDNNVFYTYSPSTGYKYRTLEEWQSFTGQDLNSKKSPVMLTDTADIKFYYNASSSNKIISLNKPMVDVKGVKYENTVTLLPYTSIILKPYPDNSVKKAGNAIIYSATSTQNYRRAIPVIFNEKGTIESLSICHTGGSGKILMAVYSDNSGTPSNLLGVSSATNVNASAGWQTVSLTNPVSINTGQTVWLSWIFEDSIGVRYAKGTPSRAQSKDQWSGGMPSDFGSVSMADYIYSVFCTYRIGSDSDPGSGASTLKQAGNTAEYSTISNLNYRRAIPVTFTEAGIIESLSISHTGGSGRILMAVYSDGSGSPSSRLGVSASTNVNASSGWQTVSLSSPVNVSPGQTVWLSWVFERTVGVRHTTGKPSRAQSSQSWSGGMPSDFGSSSLGDYKYSVFCTYRIESDSDPGSGASTLKNAGNTAEYSTISTQNYRRAIPVTFTEAGIIESLSISHTGGSGRILMAVYSDGSGSPSSRLGVSASTNVNPSSGWQTVSLSSPVNVSPGQTVWLSWVFERTVGVRHTTGKPSRAQSSQSWAGGMPSDFGSSSLGDYKYSVFCTYRAGSTSGSTTVKTAGNTDEYSTISNLNYRRAIPVTFSEAGIIESLSISHTGGSGRILMAVYSDGSGSPSSRLGVSASTNVNASSGWQTVSLSSPVGVSPGQTVWLSWVFERTVGVRHTTGKPSRAQSSQSWAGGMPSDFGSSSLGDYKYSVFCTYRAGSTSGSTTDKTAGNTSEYSTISTQNYRRAIPVTFTEAGIIESLSISHTGGSGRILMAVYSDGSGSPSSRLGVSASTNVNASSGWQTVSLSSPVGVSPGQTVWLSWVFERTVGVRHTTGTPSRAQSSQSWAGGMPSDFGSSSLGDYKYSVFCTYRAGSTSGSTTDKTVGNTDEYSTISNLNYRRAIPVTFTEAGIIESLSISHTGGSGRILMAVYSDGSGSPSSRLGVSASTNVNASSGWQTVSLSSPVGVSPGQTVWLSWVFERTVGVRHTTGSPSRAQSSQSWSGGMPSDFGSAGMASYKYSVYCTYVTGGSSLKAAGNTDEYSTISTQNYRRAIPVTFTEAGIIESLSISHTGGSGRILMAVYSDGSGSPSKRLGVSASTNVNASSGWQTVSLSSPVGVSPGQTVWLSWVFERTVGVRHTTGTPSRAQSSQSWSGGMPSDFGSAGMANYKYSVYCNYRSGNSQYSGDINPNAKKAVKDFSLITEDTESLSDPEQADNDEMVEDSYSTTDAIQRMIVYPNPTSGNVTVGFEEAFEDKHLLLIYDLQGRLIKTVNVEPYSNNIDVSIFDRKKGIYLFILKDMTNGVILNRSRVKKY